MTRNLILLGVLAVAACSVLVGGVSAQPAENDGAAIRDRPRSTPEGAGDRDRPARGLREGTDRRERTRDRAEASDMGPGYGMTPGGRVRMLRGDNPQIEQMHVMMEMVERISDVAFTPQSAGLLAIGGLKDDVRRSPKEVAEDLENLLAETKTLGLRNALRMTLKDIYKGLGDNEKVLDHMRAMFKENDAALSK